MQVATSSVMMMMMMMMMIMNCFCGMADRRKVLSLISSWDHCQRFSPSRISNPPRAGFGTCAEPEFRPSLMKLCSSDNQYITAPLKRQRQPRQNNNILCKTVWQIYRATSRRMKLCRTNQDSNFLGDGFSNKDNVRALLQLRRERQPHHFKR